MTVQVMAPAVQVPAQIKLRPSVTQMSDDDLARYRNAVTGFMARTDNRGYQYFSNWHGVAFGLCQHHNDLFLPWHRGYLYHFELALQDVDPQVSLPWWNWMDESGLPAAFTDADASSNPLQAAPVQPIGVQPQPDWPTETVRDPGVPQDPAPVPPPLAAASAGGQSAYDWLMNSPSYDQFQQRCWRLHDNIHVWVGGTMSDPNWAAYDPIFWSHHAMVDRLWRIWQNNNSSALPTQDVLDTSMTFATAPSLKVSEVLDVTQLGYDYAAQAAGTGGTA